MNTLKLYRFSSPIQLTPLADNPNTSSEEGSLYYNSTDAVIKLRKPESWEDLATESYVNSQEFGSDNISVSGKAEKDYLRWDGLKWSATSPQQSYTSGSENDVIATNSSGFIDASFLQYDLDRNGYTIYNLPEPIENQEAATKNYVDSQEFGANNILMTFANVSGAKDINDLIRWNGEQWQNVAAVWEAAPGSGLTDEIISTNQYGFLDSSFLKYDLDRDEYRIFNLPTPLTADEAATKGYVDSQPFGADNIEITNIQNKDLLQYDAPSLKWKNVRGLALENTGSITNVFVTATTLEENVTNSFSYVDNSVTEISTSMSIEAVGGTPTKFTIEKGAFDVSVGDIDVDGELSFNIKDNNIKIGSSGGSGGGDTYITINNSNTFEAVAVTNNNNFNVQQNNISTQVNNITECSFVTQNYDVATEVYTTNVEATYEVTTGGGGGGGSTRISADNNKLSFRASAGGGGGGGGGGDTIINITNNTHEVYAQNQISNTSNFTVNSDTHNTYSTNSTTEVTNYYEQMAKDPVTNQPKAGSKADKDGSLRNHATTFRRSAGKNDPDNAALHLVEKYDTDLILTSNGSGYIASASFSSTDFAGARIEYRLKDKINGSVRVGTLYVGANNGNASFTDHYAETDDLDVLLSAQVVGTQVQLAYENGAHDKSLHFDAKYFPH